MGIGKSYYPLLQNEFKLYFEASELSPEEVKSLSGIFFMCNKE